MARVVHGAKATLSAQDDRCTKGPSLGPGRRASLLISQMSIPFDLNRLADGFSSLGFRFHRTAKR